MAEIIFKKSEKLLIWMHRSKYTQQEVAKELGITRQTLASKIEDNYWTGGELATLKRLGIE
jgi:DNA-binding XRE family transcriptional regulator